MSEGDNGKYNIGVGAYNYDNTNGGKKVTTGDVMLKGNGNEINIGLVNLDFPPNSFFSNNGGSHITKIGEIMNDGDFAKLNVGVSA